MLEDRLDDRINGVETDRAVGLADRWKMNRLERAAQKFDDVADQIEAGLVRVRGADEASVVARLRDRADGVRDGSQPPKRRRRGKTVRPDGDDRADGEAELP